MNPYARGLRRLIIAPTQASHRIPARRGIASPPPPRIVSPQTMPVPDDKAYGTVDSPQNLAEKFEVFDKDNISTGQQIPRGTVHSEGLFHRAVQVLVLNGNNQVLLQQRNPKKDTAGGCWDLSCSEHLQPNEAYDDAAKRGMKEELGIDIANVKNLLPFFLQSNSYPNGNVDNEFVECWMARYDGPIKVDAIEVIQTEWVDFAEFVNDVTTLNSKRPFAPWVTDTITRLRKDCPQMCSE